MNLKELRLSFDLEYWLSDSDQFGKEPSKIKTWCNQYFLHNHNIKWCNTCESITVSLYNVPQKALTWILLTLPHVSVLEHIKYAPIAEKVLELFDFGDNL